MMAKKVFSFSKNEEALMHENCYLVSSVVISDSILINIIPQFPAPTYPSGRSNCKVLQAEAWAGCEEDH